VWYNRLIKRKKGVDKMKVTFANSRLSERFCCIKSGAVFMDDSDEIFIKGFHGEEIVGMNVQTGETYDFGPDELVYPLPGVELIIT
jgi:hypothetical protein